MKWSMKDLERIEIKPLPGGGWRAEFAELGFWAEHENPWEAAALVKRQLESYRKSQVN